MMEKNETLKELKEIEERVAETARIVTGLSGYKVVKSEVITMRPTMEHNVYVTVEIESGVVFKSDFERMEMVKKTIKGEEGLTYSLPVFIEEVTQLSKNVMKPRIRVKFGMCFGQY